MYPIRTLLTGLLLLLFSPGWLPAQTAAELSAPANISLQPGDVVRVGIWREAELSGDFPVDPAGDATFPLLGKMHVAGIPIAALTDTLIAAYRVELRNPSITVIPLRRIYVLGDIARPGLYTVEPSTSLAAAVALAGGPNGQGDLNRIRVIRDGSVVLEKVPMQQAIHVVDVRSGDQIYIGRIPWLKRNGTYAFGLALTLYSFLSQILN